MASCFCREKQPGPSTDDAVIPMEAEIVPMNPLESSDDEDFENVEVGEVEEEKYDRQICFKCCSRFYIFVFSCSCCSLAFFFNARNFTLFALFYAFSR